MKQVNIVLLVVGLVSSIVLILGVWQGVVTYQTLTSKVPVKSTINVADVKEVMKLWEQRKPFNPDGSNVASGEAEVAVASESASLVGVTVQILNGSGVTGAASTWRTKLEEIRGISIDSLGNTAVATVTQVSSKSTVPTSIRSAVVAVLEKEFKNVKEGTLGDDSNVDMVVTLGK